MSIGTEIVRLTTLRNNIRTKLLSLGVISNSAADLSACYSGINGITAKATSTYTPGSVAQTIASGQYLTGVQTIAGDANLIPDNIIAGVSIFGVSGAASGATAITVSNITNADGGTETYITAVDLTGDTVRADVLLPGYTAHTAMGSAIVGTYSASMTPQEKEAFPSDAVQIITPDTGYYLNQVTVNAIPSDYITGYKIFTRTLSGTYSNPDLQATKVATFTYCTSLTSINLPNCLLLGSSTCWGCTSLTSASLPLVKSVSYGAFQGCTKLTSLNLPEATTIGGSVCAGCTALTSFSFPKATTIGSYCFRGCTNSGFTYAYLPKATYLSTYLFSTCYSLKTVIVGAASMIYAGAFYRCTRLQSLYVLSPSLCALSNINALSSTPIYGYSTSAGYFGSVYVPESLYSNYCAATNWKTVSSRIVSMTSAQIAALNL